MKRIGQERALLYLFAALTGLRRKEIATLTWGNLDLEGDAPTVTVEARYSKNRRKDSVVLSAALAGELIAWRRQRADELGREVLISDPVLHVGRMIVHRLREDCRYVGIEVEDAAGRVVDFHALRHTTATLLSRAKVSPRAAQAHLRHSSITQTMKTYTHLEMLDRVQASEALSSAVENTQENGTSYGTSFPARSRAERPDPTQSRTDDAGGEDSPIPLTPSNNASLRTLSHQRAQTGIIKRLVGATGLEPVTRHSESIDNRRLTKDAIPNDTIYGTSSAPDPVEKLAKAWDTLSPDVQATLAALIEQITTKAKPEQQFATESQKKNRQLTRVKKGRTRE